MPPRRTEPPPAEGTPFAAEVLVRGQRFANEESGFAVLDGEADGRHVVLVGPLAHLEADERATVTGAWVRDPRYGAQVRVREAHPLAPSDEAALVAYLRRVRHVGPRRAAALFAAHGADVLQAVDADPRRAFERAGLSPARAREAARSWDALRATRGLHLLLAPHGLAHLAARIHRHYGDRAYRLVAERPYELTAVFGVGFATADAIARGVGVPPDAPARARAALLHVLAEAERDGSTCLPEGALLAAAGELLGVGTPDTELLGAMEEAGDLELDRDGDALWVYRAETAALERELAEHVHALLASEPSAKLHPPEAPPKGIGFRPAGDRERPPAGDVTVELAVEQWAGVQGAFAHRFSLVTGGPGTGKTASIRMIGAIAAQQRASLVLVAPTGRAALRMREATGLEASTVHAALGWIPGEGPTLDADQPLRCDLLVVDETSMANLELLVTLLRAVGPETHVVLVGDADQLAPVGAGKPFAELVASGLVPTARLAHIFRQAAGSMIVQGAHAIRAGGAPSFTPREGMRQDLFLIERADPVAARAEIAGLVSRRLPDHYGVDPVNDVQVFAPVYRGELGIDALNDALRAALNPHGAPVGNGRLRIGDKLMLVGRNLHELGIMNGTLLRLLEALEPDDGDDEDGGASGLLVATDAGAVIEIPPGEVGNLRLAYACSVHRGQGIELPIAIVVAHPAAGGRFLRREMLYTAITRARTATVVVGTGAMVARAAATADVGRRHSRLATRLARAG
ncbi:MAG: AAA family ATPase [Actinobacteria bacterium]|nr:AAA family ATPase [Actinomycetota bacterium]